MLRIIIGLVIPYAAVIGMLPWVASVDQVVLGIPFIYMWIFVWFLLTSLCMYVVWQRYDRHRTDDQ